MKQIYQIGLKKFIFPLFLLYGFTAAGQTQERIMNTAKTSMNEEVLLRDEEAKNFKKHRNEHIVTTHLRNIGYGNKCVTEATHKLGFTYVPMPINEVERRSAFYYFIHNQATRFKITLKNGPFWQHTLKKRIKECLQITGDLTG
jgi:hypothetical protein